MHIQTHSGGGVKAITCDTR